MSTSKPSQQKPKETWYIGKYFDQFKNASSHRDKFYPLIDTVKTNKNSNDSSATLADSVGSDSEAYVNNNNHSATTTTTTTTTTTFSSPTHTHPNRVFNSVDNMIGTIRIEVFGMKYISLSKPSLLIEVENDMFPSYSTSFDHMFHFSDISSEILILILEEYDNANNNNNDNSNDIKQPSSCINDDGLTNNPKIRGQIVLPIAQYVTLLSPKTVQKEWRQFLPLYTTANACNHPIISDRPIGRFYSGDESFSGSALKKTREKIGFVELSIEVQLLDYKRPYQLYFAKPYHYYYLRDRKQQPPQLQGERIQSTKQQHSYNLNLLSKYLYNYNNANNIQQTETEIEIPSDNNTASSSSFVLHYTLTQLTRRIKYILNCMCTPFLFTPFITPFYLPESMIGLVVYGCLCYAFSPWAYPLVLYLMVLLNGVLTAVLRGGSSSSSSGRGSGGGEAIVIAWNDYFEGDVEDSNYISRDIDKNNAVGKTAGINNNSDTVEIDSRTNNNIASPNIRSSKETAISSSSSPRARSSSSTHVNTHQNKMNGTSNITATHNNDATLAAAAALSGNSSTHNHIHSDSSPFILAAATSAYINLLTDITSILETFYHAFHFTADVKTSFLFYILLLMVALLSSLVIAVLSVRGYIFIIGLIVILAITLRKQVHYLLEFSRSDSSYGDSYVEQITTATINSNSDNNEQSINSNDNEIPAGNNEFGESSDRHSLQSLKHTSSLSPPILPETAMSMLIDTDNIDIDFVDYLTVSDEEYFTRVVAAAAAVDTTTTIHDNHNNNSDINGSDSSLAPNSSNKNSTATSFTSAMDSSKMNDNNNISINLQIPTSISSGHNHHNRPQQQSKHHRHLPLWLMNIGKFIVGLYYLWCRMPDQLEYNHRYIAGLSSVRLDGPEMEDAAEFYNHPNKNKQ